MDEQPLVEIRNLSKTFGSTPALTDVSLGFMSGQVHAVVGQNGSGKSTLFKILAGVYTPDRGRGSIAIRGEEQRLPLHAKSIAAYGFAFVHQDLGLSETLTVTENICLSAPETGRLWRIRSGTERRKVRQLLDELNVKVAPDALVGELSQAERTMVAIVRALHSLRDNATLLVLDEPTAYLAPPDRERLFEAIRNVAARGVAIAVSTHRLDEVRRLAQRITVLRDGRVVATFGSGLDVSDSELVTALLGRDLGDLVTAVPDAHQRPVALEVHSLTGGRARKISFALHRGEILGVTGALGAAHEDIPYLIYGALPITDGELWVGPKRMSTTSPRTSRKHRIGLLPANRQRDSGWLQGTIRENVTLLTLGSFFSRGALQGAREERAVRQAIQRFDVRPQSVSPDAPLYKLSGGNQQKALLAKWLTVPQLDVLLLHEPVQGIDVASKETIYGHVLNAAAEGTAVLLVSAEYGDLVRLCDRVLVVGEHGVHSELVAPHIAEDRIVDACYRSLSLVTQ